MSLPAGRDDLAGRRARGTSTRSGRATGPPREVPAVDFVTGNHANVLRPGELLRSIHLPASALVEAVRVPPRFAHQARPLRRAADRHAAIRRGTICCSRSPRQPPARCSFASTQIPSAEALRQAIDARIPADGYFDDVHGSAAYKRHLTYHFAEQIRAELAQPGAGA